jgi:O-methyltransferase
MLRRILKKIGYINQQDLLRNNYVLPKTAVTYANDYLYTLHNAGFLENPKFLQAYEIAKKTDGGKLLHNYDIQWRIHVLCWAAQHAAKLEGDFVDCGVHTGIFARAIIDYINFNTLNKKYYLLDTFSGLDEKYSTADELLRNNAMGYAKQDSEKLYNDVLTTFAAFNAEVIRGTVPDTLSNVQTNRVAFLSIDMNCVAPEVAAMEFFWDKLVSGAVIVIDDYGYMNQHDEQRKAHDKFAKGKNVEILILPTCQGLIIKP